MRRINAVLRTSRDNNVRFLWVGDIAPPTSPLRSGGMPATTLAYVSEDSGRSFVEYTVQLRCNEAACSAYAAGNWKDVFPDTDSMSWFTIDRRRKTLDIEIAG